MQRSVCRFATAATIILGGIGLGFGQGPVSPQPPEYQDDRRRPPAATRTVNLTLEQRHVIRELVRELKVAKASDDMAMAAGDQVPGKVDLHPIPPLIAQKVPQIKSHRFYATERQIVIVDPQERKVVEVIE